MGYLYILPPFPLNSMNFREGLSVKPKYNELMMEDSAPRTAIYLYLYTHTPGTWILQQLSKWRVLCTRSGLHLKCSDCYRWIGARSTVCVDIAWFRLKWANWTKNKRKC